VAYTITAGNDPPFKATAVVGKQKFKGLPQQSKKLAFAAAASVRCLSHRGRRQRTNDWGHLRPSCAAGPR
jgi:hypothetical protein